MKLPSLIGVAGVSVLCLSAARADPTAPVNPAQRNGAYAPAASLNPEKKAPVLDDAIQGKRVEPATIAKVPAAVGERRAAIEVREGREKNVREKNSSRPAAGEQAMSTFNHRPAPFTTAHDTTTPPVVAKYQDGLRAASAANMARFPALDRATTAKINRFVFRKNSPNPAPVTDGAPITPAGGESRLRN